VFSGTITMFTLVAMDAYGNTGAIYTGTVHFSSSDAAANLPADYTFTDADGGMHEFAVVFNTTGSQSLTATDTVDSTITGTLGDIVVV
jgi:adhesin/invasin